MIFQKLFKYANVVLKKLFLLLRLKTVVLLTIFVETIKLFSGFLKTLY